MTRRRLSPEDRELWERVRLSAKPLDPSRDGRLPAPPPLKAPVPAPAMPLGPASAVLRALRPFRVGEAVDPRRPHDLAPGWLEGLGRLPIRMDAAAFGRLARGKLRPEARLDLHGMTLAEAHGALAGWILESRARGRRLVLVITGKGRAGELAADGTGAGGIGRLRRDVPRWLSLPPLAGAVLQVAPAHRRHGGQGALYVYLRAT